MKEAFCCEQGGATCKPRQGETVWNEILCLSLFGPSLKWDFVHLSIWTKFALNCSSSPQTCGYGNISYPLLSLNLSLSFNSANPPVLVPFPALLCPPTLQRAAPSPSNALSRDTSRSAGPFTLPSHATGQRFSVRKQSNSTSVCPKLFSFENRVTKQVATEKGIWGDRGRAQVSRLGHQKQQRRELTAKETARAPEWGDIMASWLPLLHSAPLNSYWGGLTAATWARPDAEMCPGATQTALSSLCSPVVGWHPLTPLHGPGCRAGGHLAQSYGGCSIALASQGRDAPALGPCWRHGWAGLPALSRMRYMLVPDPTAQEDTDFPWSLIGAVTAQALGHPTSPAVPLAPAHLPACLRDWLPQSKLNNSHDVRMWSPSLFEKAWQEFPQRKSSRHWSKSAPSELS